MSELLVREFNIETGKEIVRPLSADELEAYNRDHAKNLIEAQADQEKEIAKNALLEKLGITTDEAKLLLS
jgi:hypothetical protein